MKVVHPDLDVDGTYVPLVWNHEAPIGNGWVRYDASACDGLIAAQAFVSSQKHLVDVFNRGPAPMNIRFDDRLTLEFGRAVQPHTGIGWTQELVAQEAVTQPYDHLYSPEIPFPQMDVAYTLTTGSPRNFFFDPHRHRAVHFGPSTAMNRWFDRFTRYQLMRNYQSVGARALPSWYTTGQVFKGFEYNHPDFGAITPFDTHHMTISVLADDYMFTGNPRALDQIVRILVVALSTENYYNPNYHWPYGGTTRVPGWLLYSLADALPVFERAGDSGMFNWTMGHIRAHLNLLEKLGFSENGPNIINPPDPGRHLPVPFHMPWHDAIVCFAATRLAGLGVPGARKVADDWFNHIDARGWDIPDGCGYDSIAHYLDADGSPEHPPKGGTCNGIGLWMVAPYILRNDTLKPFADNAIHALKTLNSEGKPVWSADSSFGMSLAAPLILKGVE